MARWEEYKAANPAMVGKRAVLQLLECCDDELRKDLTRNAGGSLADRPETEVLAAIKLLAVRQEALMVSRNILWNMQQDHNERIRTFGARLRGQAGMCNLTVKCCKEGCEQINSFMDQIIRDVLICGVSNYEIRLAILQDKNQDMSLEELFNHQGKGSWKGLCIVDAGHGGDRCCTVITVLSPDETASPTSTT